MESPNNSTTELYNLRWNSYFSNLINVFAEHQHQEALVDVTLSCEGQFIKAHKLILSACSVYFQKMFETHSASPLVILLNDVKFRDLQLVVQFMYKGEVKVADADMPQFLALGKLLQIKGLCSVDLQDKHPQPQSNGDAKSKTAQTTTSNESKKITCKKIMHVDSVDDKQTPAPKKRKLSTPPPLPPPAETKKKAEKQAPSPSQTKIPTQLNCAPSAFMLFANQWRKKLEVEYPNESNKDISVRLGNMWKSLARETKDAFYEDAWKLKYPGLRDQQRNKTATISNKVIQKPTSTTSEEELLEKKCPEKYGTDSRRNSDQGS